MEIKFGADEIAQLHRAFERMPGEVRAKVMARTMRRIGTMAKTRVVARSSKHTNMPAALVRALTTAKFNAGGNSSSVVVESNWIPLHALGAVQNAKGTFVNKRGQYDHAFVTKFASGHVGVMQRIPGTQMPSSKGKREQIRELFGANPAHAITNDPETYLDVVAELIEEVLWPRMAHEMEHILARR